MFLFLLSCFFLTLSLSLLYSIFCFLCFFGKNSLICFFFSLPLFLAMLTNQKM